MPCMKSDGTYESVDFRVNVNAFTLLKSSIHKKEDYSYHDCKITLNLSEKRIHNGKQQHENNRNKVE